MDKRIKELRRTLDLTQQEFGDRIGVKRNTIATYEGGRSTPIDSVISLICREFNVNETWLRTGNGEMFSKSSDDLLEELAKKYSLKIGEVTVIEKFIKLKADKRAAIMDYVYDVVGGLIETTKIAKETGFVEAQKTIDPETATDEEKVEAYRDYLEEKKEERREAN